VFEEEEEEEDDDDDDDDNNNNNSKVIITKSKKTLAPEYIYTTAKICNSWHMFNCKKLFKLRIRPPSLILLITTSRNR